MRFSIRRLRGAALVTLGILLGVAGYAGISEGVLGSGSRIDNDGVRIAAKKHEDGRIELVVQHQRRGGEWSERVRPEARFLPADAENDVWFHSSTVRATADQSPPAGACLIHHSLAEQDTFWSQVHHMAHVFDYDFHALSVSRSGSVDGAAQAAAIRECVAQGNRFIAATLADPEAVSPALAEARAAGAMVITFNSGGDFSAEAGALLHVGLNDTQAGEAIGAELTAHGVERTLVCLIHEATNVGLAERCDGLEAGYGGAVSRVRLGDDADAAIAEAISASDVGAAVYLNAGTGARLAAVAEAAQSEIVIAGVGADAAMIPSLLSGRISFIYYDQPQMQGAIAVAMLRMLEDQGPTGALLTAGASIEISGNILRSEELRAIIGMVGP